MLTCQSGTSFWFDCQWKPTCSGWARELGNPSFLGKEGKCLQATPFLAWIPTFARGTFFSSSFSHYFLPPSVNSLLNEMSNSLLGAFNTEQILALRFYVLKERFVSYQKFTKIHLLTKSLNLQPDEILLMN